MVKTKIAVHSGVLLSGVLLGILATLVVERLGPSSDDSPGAVVRATVRDIVDVPKMAQVVADKHREEQYVGLTSVEEALSLPTEFARAEALHALAGRADSAGVQNLIFEANRVGDPIERTGLLKILFFRLAETDPRSALALSRTDDFRAIRSIEQTVWRAWARNDFEDALFEAKLQTAVTHQNSAAQGLYAAFGYLGNETTDRIEVELGIGPDRKSRGGYLYRLADSSPTEAIAFINGVEPGTQHRQYVAWLAHYLSSQDPAMAQSYADLFRAAADVEYYRRIVSENVGVQDPQATVEQFLVNGDNRRSGEFHRAVAALASTDILTAKQYFRQARSADARQTLGSAIASEMAKQDPLAALAWARANETDRFPRLQMTVFREIARTDPQLALTEAGNSPNVQMRSMLISVTVQQMAGDSPATAVAYLDQIQDPQQKLEASESLLSSWLGRDPDAAIDWVLSQEKEVAADMIHVATVALLNHDIDAAMRLLPKIDGKNQVSARRQIAQRLALNYSPDEAQTFIRQFVGEPDYDQLQAVVISGVARTDVIMAKQLADQLPDNGARDSAYVQVIAQHAQTDPVEAARWLRSVGDDSLRGAATGQIAAQWYGHDPAAATRWVVDLPSGPSRDDAIMQLSSQFGEPTAEQEKLIASIQDRNKRGRAKLMRVYSMMQTDPEKAKKLLEDEDIPSDQRQQIKAMMLQNGSIF